MSRRSEWVYALPMIGASLLFVAVVAGGTLQVEGWLRSQADAWSGLWIGMGYGLWQALINTPENGHFALKRFGKKTVTLIPLLGGLGWLADWLLSSPGSLVRSGGAGLIAGGMISALFLQISFMILALFGALQHGSEKRLFPEVLGAGQMLQGEYYMVIYLIGAIIGGVVGSVSSRLE